MLKKTLLIVAAALVLSSTMTMAQSWDKSSFYYNATGPRSAETTLLGDGDCLTQSVDGSVIVAGTVACNAGGIVTDNSFIRVYDLPSGAFTPDEVQYGVETAAGNTGISVNLYAIPAGSNISVTGLPAVTCGTALVQADGDLLFESVAVAGCPAIDGDANDLVVEVLTDDCQETGCINYFHGSNGLGETGPSYIAAEDCGIVNPVTFADIGFAGIHLLLDVCGGGTTSNDVPAVGPLGALFTILALGAGSGYVIRRRREA